MVGTYERRRSLAAEMEHGAPMSSHLSGLGLIPSCSVYVKEISMHSAMSSPITSVSSLKPASYDSCGLQLSNN